jgi:hypothetical protein
MTLIIMFEDEKKRSKEDNKEKFNQLCIESKVQS